MPKPKKRTSVVRAWGVMNSWGTKLHPVAYENRAYAETWHENEGYAGKVVRVEIREVKP